MNVDIFLDQDEATRARLERIFAVYPELFQIRWHSAAEAERYMQLYLASLPLDYTTGHGVAGEVSPGVDTYQSYGYSGYYQDDLTPPQFPALALFDRLALVPSHGGPPRQIRPGVWAAPFETEELLRGAFHQALEAAFAELREAHVQLRATHLGLLELPNAARLLQVTPVALHRALRR